MIITGHEYKLDFANVAVRMLNIANFQTAEDYLKDIEQDVVKQDFPIYKGEYDDTRLWS